MGSPRIGLIGAGEIAEWHVRALRIAQCTVSAVATRAGSSRAQHFAERHNIPRTFDGWNDMLDHHREWDGLVLATHTDATGDILERALEMRVPVLVEKPVAWTSTRIAALRMAVYSPVIVGFNRRFYSTVQFAREVVASGPPLLAHMSLPEALVADETDAVARCRPFFSNSCHGLDLLRFVFGPLSLKSVTRLAGPGGQLNGFAATLMSSRGDVIELSGNWGTPANFALSLDRPGRRVELKPLELASIFEGMEVLEPSNDIPIRRYVPILRNRVGLETSDRLEKPGFVQQALAFKALFETDTLTPTVAARLEDAEAAIRLAEELVGQIQLDE